HVGDEPTDVLFAGSPQRAFVCVSGEDSIKSWDAATRGSYLATKTQLARHPHALATNSAGTELYVSVGQASNGTTVIPADTVQAGGGLPRPNPAMDGSVAAAPHGGLIVHFNGQHWVDERPSSVKTWDTAVKYSLPHLGLLVYDTGSLAQLRTRGDLSSNNFNI